MDQGETTDHEKSAASAWVPTIGLVFRFTVGMDDGSNTPQVTLAYQAVEPGVGVSQGMADLIDTFIAPYLPPVVTPIDLEALEDALQASVTVLKAWLSGNASLTRLAVRLEIESLAANSDSQWSDFLAGTILDNPLKKGWTLFLDRQILLASFASQFNASFLKQSQENKFKLSLERLLSTVGHCEQLLAIVSRRSRRSR